MQRGEDVAGRDIPDNHMAISAGGDKACAVWRKGNATYPVGVAVGKCVKTAARLRVPQSHDTVVSSSDETPIVWAETEGSNAAWMVVIDGQAAPAPQVPAFGLPIVVARE